jgi:lipid-binding SYLF domain-containing protein
MNNIPRRASIVAILNEVACRERNRCTCLRRIAEQFGRRAVCLVLLLGTINQAWAGPIKEAVTGAADFVGDTVSDTAKSAGKAVADVSERITGNVNYAEVRKEIDQIAKASLGRLFRAVPQARDLFNRSYGYAVFDNRKTAFFLATGSGAGVAVNKGSGKRTYMRMGSLGANLGAGVQFYQSVFLFETEPAFNSFVHKGWEANTAADASFGKAAAAAEVKFNGGMAFYNIAESGALVSVSIAGTKYWVSDDLNKKGR